MTQNKRSSNLKVDIVYSLYSPSSSVFVANAVEVASPTAKADLRTSFTSVWEVLFILVGDLDYILFRVFNPYIQTVPIATEWPFGTFLMNYKENSL